ncbi:MAG: GNAT family N-acetyltransferase [Hyphomicrobiaceae bacterium]|nr:MAG: GNAT family N-acetyltransferase [Hyphomicrobiaceae bacterium]
MTTCDGRQLTAALGQQSERKQTDFEVFCCTTIQESRFPLVSSVNPVNIRQATEQDIPRLQALLRDLHAPHVRALPERFAPRAVGEWDRDLFRGYLSSPSQVVLAAERSGEVVGFARAEFRNTSQGVAHLARTYVEVHEICIDPAARRSGAGRLLLEAVKDWAKRQNASSLELSVYAFNEAALAFYRRVGLSDMRITLATKLT